MKPFIRLSAMLFTIAVAGLAIAADPPPTAEVLGKLHRSNLKEIEMGKMARSHGTSKEAKAFGKTLVDDHSAADKKVGKLAKEEKIDLTANTPAAQPMPQLPMGSGFDAAFGKAMVQDHDKAIAEVKAARDATDDAKLKSLLEAVLPVLEKHREMAQKLAGSAKS